MSPTTSKRPARVHEPWVPILGYHSISRHAAPGFRRYTLAPDLFRQHLVFLAESGYRTTTVSALAAVLEADGVRVEVFGDNAYGVGINLTDARVMVPDEQAEAARDIIRAADAIPSDPEV